MARTTSTWRLLPAALLVVAAFAITPIVRFYANNLHEGLSRGEIASYGAAFALAVAVLYAIVHAIVRPQTTRLPAVFCALLVCSTGYYDLCLALENEGFDATAQNTAWGTVTVLLVGLAARFGATTNGWLFVQCFAGLGLLVPALAIASYDAPDGGPGLPPSEAFPLAGNPIWSGEAKIRPDVYWIVVDSYPNREVLQRLYAFDNQPFLLALERRGFVVANESFANYSTTRLSVPTTLDMQYVLDPGERYSEARGSLHVRLPGNTNSGMIAAVAGDNRTVAFFRQLGYRYVHFEGNSFHLTRCRGLEDHCIRGGGLSELQLSLLSLLPARLVVGGVTGHMPGLMLTRSPSASGTGIPELAEALRSENFERPFFLYAHFATPHPPFYVDGECRRAPGNYPINPTQFVEQVRCVNKQLQALLDQIEQGDPDAIVVVSADHGPRMSAQPNVPTSALTPKQIRESLGILNAFKLPEACRSAVYAKISPVNTMRVVFACLGGEPPKLLEDLHFVARPSADRGIVRQVRID